jgi:hypothetical protein
MEPQTQVEPIQPVRTPAERLENEIWALEQRIKKEEAKSKPSAPFIQSMRNLIAKARAESDPEAGIAVLRQRTQASEATASAVSPCVVDAADFVLEVLPPREPLMLTDDGTALFSMKSINQIWAWRGTGKTNLELGIIHALITGGSIFNWQSVGAHKVLLVEGEMPEQQVQQRIRDLMGDVPRGMFHLITLDKQPNNTIPVLASEQGQAFVETALEKSGAKVLFLDSLSTLCPIDENDKPSWHGFVAWLQRLRSRGMAVFFLHHAGKGGKQRGHSVSEDQLDVSISLTKPEDAPNGTLSATLKFDKFRDKGNVSNLRIGLKDGEWSFSVIDDSKKQKNAIKLFESGMTKTAVKKTLGVNGETVSRWYDEWRENRGADAETILAAEKVEADKKASDRRVKENEKFESIVSEMPDASIRAIAKVMAIGRNRVDDVAERLGWSNETGKWVKSVPAGAF